MEFENLRKENLCSLVKENLKVYFRKNNLKGGDPIPTEAELAEGLGVSRTAVREGLKSLESLGIIEVKPGVGRFLKNFNFDSILENLTYSIEMDVRDFRDLLEVRIALESSFIGDYIHSYTEDQLARLEGIIAEMRRLDTEGCSEEALIQVHTRFHIALYKDHGNQLLQNLIKIFSTVQRTVAVLNHYRIQDMGKFIELHVRIIAAIRSREPQVARLALIAHFDEPQLWSAESRKVVNGT